VDAVVKSLREFGWRSPIVVDAEGVIICGHTRYKTAHKMGLIDVPVHVARDLTPDQIRAYRIADNQTATLSSWDAELLPVELAALREADFDLDTLGFSAEQLAEWMVPEAAGAGVDPDTAPEVDEAAEPDSMTGEIYQLGRHRLMCGDSAKAEDVSRLMGGEVCDLLLTDPPYGVSYKGSDGLTIENDDLPEDELRKFLAQAFAAGAKVMLPGAGFYVWHADRLTAAFRAACQSAGLDVRQGLVWVKNALVLGRSDYQWRHEPVLYGWLPGAAHRWFGDRKQTTVLEFDKPSKNGEHPTIKPTALFELLIQNSCPPGGLVLDLFAGSGTTALAAERTGRRAKLMELAPKYCDVIRKRYAAFLNGDPCDWKAATPPVMPDDGPARPAGGIDFDSINADSSELTAVE
jgi:site-specific DNA-methyltransferase (adenine-specific)